MNAADIISTHGLSMDISPVMENPYLIQDGSDLVPFYCSLKNDAINFDFYISVDPVYAVNLTAEFCLARVLEDIGAFRSCDNYEAFCSLIGIDEEDGRARLGFEEIKRISENLDLMLANENDLTSGPGI